jgi:hypothetical protein
MAGVGRRPVTARPRNDREAIGADRSSGVLPLAGEAVQEQPGQCFWVSVRIGEGQLAR